MNPVPLCTFHVLPEMMICGDELISDGMPTDNFRTWPNPGSKRGMGVKQQKPSNSGELEFNELTPEV